MLSPDRYVSGPVPSMTYIKYYIFTHLLNHPLMVNPPIYHPISGRQVKVEEWHLSNGKRLDTGKLVCSIFPYGNAIEISAKVPPTPQNAASTSVAYKETTLGNASDKEATYSFIVKFHYNEVSIGQRHPNTNIATAPVEAVIHPDQWLHTSSLLERANLFIDPSADLLGEYLELARLAIEDRQAARQIIGPLVIDHLEVLYANLIPMPWEQEDGIYVHESELFVRLTTHLSQGWRDKFLHRIKSIGISIGDS
jgi:hypothetical protein